VLFITTGHMLDRIAEPLRESRWRSSSFKLIRRKKIHIAFQYLIPRQLDENGIIPLSRIDSPRSRFAMSFAITTPSKPVSRVSTHQIGQPAAGNSRRRLPKFRVRTHVSKEMCRSILVGIKIRSKANRRSHGTPRVCCGPAWDARRGDVLFRL